MSQQFLSLLSCSHCLSRNRGSGIYFCRWDGTFAHFLHPTSSQFHNHFTCCCFFVRKFWAKLFCTYIQGLNFFWNIGANALIKGWWHWPKVEYLVWAFLFFKHFLTTKSIMKSIFAHTPFLYNANMLAKSAPLD